MAFQPEVGSGVSRAVDYRDFVTKLSQMMCSQHVATVVVNNGGTATYLVGDIMTLTDASAHLDARFEVTTVSAGVITGLRINSSGAFALQGASATVNVGGSGYQVGDILQVQGGSSRLPMKFEVATLSGSAVATVTLFEDGGVYSAAPGLTGATTIGVGSTHPTVPQTFAGDNACTLDLTMTALITPLTAVPITGGSGGGSPTVDITLDQSGWTQLKDSNDYLENTLTDEKEVVLTATEGGSINKPIFGIRTGTDTISVDTRYAVQFVGMIAYNPSLNFDGQVNNSPGVSGSDTFVNGGSYLVFPQGNPITNEVDFWLSVDDSRITGAINTNPVAATDDGRYESFYVGFGDRAKTETEDPYPMVCFASSREFAEDPTTASPVITSAAEARNNGSSGPVYMYFPEDGVWRDMLNNAGGSVVTVPEAVWPFGDLPEPSSGVEFIVTQGTVQFQDNVFKRDRSPPTRILRPVPGTVDKIYRWPVIFSRRVSSTVSQITDNVRLSLRGYFAIFNDDGAGAPINDFSEDYLSEGSAPTVDVRYRVFHNWDLIAKYQYICIHEDV